jgi:hypothetical protein
MLFGIRIKNHLNYAFAITQIEKYDAPMVSATIYPAAKRYCFVDIGCSQSATVVIAHNSISVLVTWVGLLTRD